MNSSELKGYLTGLIFGDASIDKGVTKRALNIKSINKDFIDQIHNDLSSCTSFKMRVTEHPDQTRGNTHHKKYWELRVAATPYFNKKYHHFYDDMRHRTASKEALSWITPRGLANWYMSDGYICHVGKTKDKIVSRRVDIATDRYNLATVQKMCNMLFDRFGVGATVAKRGNTYRIRIGRESYERFFNLIKDYVCGSMKYKMYLGYEQQPMWMSNEFWEFQKELGSAIAQPTLGEDIV